MKQALLRRLLGKGIFQMIGRANVVVLGTVQNCRLKNMPFVDPVPVWRKLEGLAERPLSKPAAVRGILTLYAAAFAVAILIAPPFQMASASAPQSTNFESVATSEPIALYVTICLWSQQHPAAVCNELPLTPGAAGPVFVSMKACTDGQEEAMGKWREQAGPVFGFTAMAGEGYRIERQRCGPVDKSRYREGNIFTLSHSRRAAIKPAGYEG